MAETTTPEDQYWEETVECILAEHGVKASVDQIKGIAAGIRGAHECHSMAFGLDVADRNVLAMHEVEKRRLKQQLDDERRKVTCKTCGGTGEIVTYGPYHSSSTSCHKCRGEGRHLP